MELIVLHWTAFCAPEAILASSKVEVAFDPTEKVAAREVLNSSSVVLYPVPCCHRPPRDFALNSACDSSCVQDSL